MANGYKKEELIARYDALLGVEGAKAKAEHYNYELHRMNAPDLWNVYIEGNKEIEIEVGFEEFGLEVQQHLGIDFEQLNTFQYFALKNKLKKERKHGNN